MDQDGHARRIGLAESQQAVTSRLDVVIVFLVVNTVNAILCCSAMQTTHPRITVTELLKIAKR